MTSPFRFFVGALFVDESTRLTTNCIDKGGLVYLEKADFLLRTVI